MQAKGLGGCKQPTYHPNFLLKIPIENDTERIENYKLVEIPLLLYGNFLPFTMAITTSK